MNKSISKYLKYFKKLNRGYNKGLGRAPHKPILLISIIQLINKNIINSSRIFITPELVGTFTSNFKFYVKTNHSSNFSLPFFHLKSEPFWHLSIKSGFQLAVTKSKSIKSFKNLYESIDFAEIDQELYLLLKNQETNKIALQFLLSEYFGIGDLKATNPYLLQDEIENDILNETKIKYQTKIQHLQEQLNEENYQEEIFVRGGLFKKVVPQIYNYQCCISGMKIETTTNAQMVDACHIIPFSLSHDDTITNGISLSPNLHRAFDRGLITINKDYLVRISTTIKDNASVYSISQFNDKQIILPDNSKYYPSPEALSWHSKEVFQL